ncbi:MAG: AAA family ATPase [Alphaproteobacteria bacterium]|nr:AAA family ATPase [Alphaproteobacteria bacterium]
MVSAFTRKHPWVQAVSAGSLLRGALMTDDTEALRTATASNIHANQDRLVAAFAERRRRDPEHHVIFDGHTLIDNDQRLVIVPVSVFRDLAPALIVFLEDDPLLIHARRLADPGRVRPRRSSDEIDAQQRTAKETALAHASVLAVPCAMVGSGDHAAFEAALIGAFAPPPTLPSSSGD